MIYKFITVFCFLCLLTNCSKDNDIQDVKSIIISWQLIESKKDNPTVVKHEFELDTIIWIFDEINKVLTVYNRNTDSSKRDFLESGSYSYSILEIEGRNYFYIENFEHGLLTFDTENNRLIINENIKTTGESDNRFVYTFQNKIIINE